MDSVILVVIGFMCGGAAGLIAAGVCVVSGNKKIEDENARMRKAIYKTYDELTELNAVDIKRAGSDFFYVQIKDMQDKLQNALEEG